MMDTAAYAAIRGLVRGLYRAGIITTDAQREAVMHSIWSEAAQYEDIGHQDKAEMIHKLASEIGRDLRIGD